MIRGVTTDYVDARPSNGYDFHSDSGFDRAI